MSHGTAASTGGGGTTGAAGSCDVVPKLERSSFPERPRVDNRLLPLAPGMQYVLDGFVKGDDGLHHPHRIETTVTDLTKVVGGVRTLVVFDRDLEDGRLTESELFFEAQDEDGAVWLLGEYPEEYESGKLAGAPSTWISGVAGARAGIAMPAKSRAGTPTYLQGLALKVGFKDCATTFETDQRTCVPIGCYDDVLVADEFGPLDPAGGHQRKFYAPGMGVVRVTAASGSDPETLELTRAESLCMADFADIRQLALDQDSRGYGVVPGVYGGTARARATLHAHHW
jgi:hypothetical protein